MVMVNQNGPLNSDVVKVGSNNSIILMEDSVPVTLENQPHDGVLNLSSSGAFGYVVLDRYEVTFESTEQIAPVSGSLGWTLPTGEQVTGNLTVVTGQMKAEPPLRSLRGGTGEIIATAHITIYGHEATSNAPVEVKGVLGVNFADWVD
jgi:hypothetical protein